MEKITKENLVEKIAVLRDENERLILQDQIKRKEFAKAFDWVKNARLDSFNHIEKEPQLPSWEQIFVQLGKLLVLEELKQKVIFPNKQI